MPDRAMAAQTALLRRRFRPAWSAPEDMIVERFTRAFVSGRFSSLTGVARPCKKALDRLHARHPDKPWATFPRTRQAVRGRITQRLNAAGDTWTSADFLPREQRAFDRYVREFLKGRFAHLNLAARDCWRELRRQADVVRRREFGLTGTPAPRSLKAVASQLELRTRALGRPPLSHRWSRNEFRTVDKWMRRYFAALERGTGPSEREVLGAMARELESRGCFRLF